MAAAITQSHPLELTNNLQGDGDIIMGTAPLPSLPPLMSRHEFFAEVVELSRELAGFDPCPFQVVMATPLSKVHFMFAMLGLTHALVVEKGKLVGVILKEDLMDDDKMF